MEVVKRMKQQIILWMSRISVVVVATLLCAIVSIVIAAILDDGLSGIGDNAESAHLVACFMFAIAFCLWLYG